MLGVALFSSYVAIFVQLPTRSKRRRLGEKYPSIRFVNFSADIDDSSTLVVDCTHPRADQITHHLKLTGQTERVKSALPLLGDSSTDGVLNCIKDLSRSRTTQGSIFQGKEFVTSNHFDIDSFLSVWCVVNMEAAERYEQVIRGCSRIGDFRELNLTEKGPSEYAALRLCCWMNTVEKTLFSRPFEQAMSSSDGEEDAEEKFRYFFGCFLSQLEYFTSVPSSALSSNLCSGSDEYNRVIAEYNLLHGQGEKTGEEEGIFHSITEHHFIGLVVVRSLQPLHYYSLFSASKGFDLVLAVYSGQRYELEVKYTTFVDLQSRGCLPRVDMSPLARRLNELEDSYDRESNNSEKSVLARWSCNSITDSGPVLRIDDPSRRLSKMERYGNPYERPIFPSLIPREMLESVVVSYFEFAYSKGVAPRRGWKWADYHSFNRSIIWNDWLT